MKENNNNRLYCHRRMERGININKKGKANTLYIPFNYEMTDRYALRLKNVYKYQVQYQIF